MSDNRNSGTRQVRQDGIGVTAGPTSPFATAAFVLLNLEESKPSHPETWLRRPNPRTVVSPRMEARLGLPSRQRTSDEYCLATEWKHGAHRVHPGQWGRARGTRA